jgi:hypothetical protein
MIKSFYIPIDDALILIKMKNIQTKNAIMNENMHK